MPEVIDPYVTMRLLKKLPRVVEAYHKTSFECYRETPTGGVQKISIDILDAGPDVDAQLRYHCVAKTEDGKFATGNPADSIETVLALVHWWDLDKDS